MMQGKIFFALLLLCTLVRVFSGFLRRFPEMTGRVGAYPSFHLTIMVQFPESSI
jgi:hypothetical protein